MKVCFQSQKQIISHVPHVSLLSWSHFHILGTSKTSIENQKKKALKRKVEVEESGATKELLVQFLLFTLKLEAFFPSKTFLFPSPLLQAL